jgi:hypothetical protein
MTVPEPADQWWVCCWGHVFRHPPVGEGEEIACPGPDEADVCGTYFIFEPFATEQDALDALVDQGDESLDRRPLRWAPWAGWAFGGAVE